MDEWADSEVQASSSCVSRRNDIARPTIGWLTSLQHSYWWVFPINESFELWNGVLQASKKMELAIVVMRRWPQDLDIT